MSQYRSRSRLLDHKLDYPKAEKGESQYRSRSRLLDLLYSFLTHKKAICLNTALAVDYLIQLWKAEKEVPRLVSIPLSQ